LRLAGRSVYHPLSHVRNEWASHRSHRWWHWRYEQTAELREVGAAVALSANATRFFEQFGLGSQFASRWFEVSALIYRDGRSGRLIGEHHAGSAYRQRFGAPLVGIHRAELRERQGGTWL